MMAWPVRIILHPGFHKTGTSALQAVLRHNRDRIAPHARIFLLAQIRDWVALSTRFAETLDPSLLADLRTVVGDQLRDSYPGHKPLIISCEGLSGRTPGKKGIEDYSAAIPVVHTLAQTMQDIYGDRLELTLFFTTRAAQVWLYSAYRHNLAGHRITEDFDSYATRFAKAGDLDGIVDQIGDAVPWAKMITAPLEETATHPLGPAAAILRLIDLPSDLKLLPHPAPNTGPDAAMTAQLLTLNRSGISDAELRKTKQALLDRG